MGTVPAAGRRGAAVAASAGLSLAATLAAWASLRWSQVFGWLALDRQALHAGELWRLWSAHLAHLDARHATINLAALALLALVAARMRCLRGLLLASALLMPAISLALLLALPRLQWYVGLSGLLHAWVAWLLLQYGGRIAMAGLVLLTAKLVFEATLPGTIDASFPVVPQAHVAGSVLGIALASAAACLGRLRESRTR